MTYETLDVSIRNGDIQFVDNGGYESRNTSTIKLIQLAFEQYPPDSSFSREFRVYTGDRFSKVCDFSYAITKKEEVPRSIPHYLFDAWPEIGIQSYQQTFQEMLDAGNAPWQYQQVFWIGANTNRLRVDCSALTRKYPGNIDFRLMEWNRKDPSALHKNTATYVSLIDHCKYRVLIDLGAGGFSARLPLLFASGRPVILADREFESWFYWDGTLQPWVHYIPGGHTVDSIEKACKWTFENQEEARKIGERGREYAKTYFNQDAIIKYCAKVLWNYSS